MDPNIERQALLARWRERDDRDALERLIREDIESIKRGFRFEVAGRSRDGACDSTDYVHAALERLLRRTPPPEFEATGQFRSYLIRTAVNLYRNHFRSAQRRPVRIEVEQLANLAASMGRSQSSALDLAEFTNVLRIALNLLPREESELLAEHLLRGVTVREIAQRSGQAPSTIGSRIITAKANLATKLVAWKEWFDAWSGWTKFVALEDPEGSRMGGIACQPSEFHVEAAMSSLRFLDNSRVRRILPLSSSPVRSDKPVQFDEHVSARREPAILDQRDLQDWELRQ